MRPSCRSIRMCVVGVTLAGLLGGCADGPRVWGSGAGAIEFPSLEPPSLSDATSPAAVHSGQLIAAQPSVEPDAEQAAPTFTDELFDPFATESDTVEEYDPWEPYNAWMFEVNRKIDKYALKPIAQGYNWVMPDAAQRGVQNFFRNVQAPPRFFNNMFQGKLKGAGTELGRFLLNSTVGLAGFFDVAERLHLVTPDEDFGQTLGFYGVPPGPYLILPLLPPFTLRDATGYVMDIALNPINWLVFPIIEIKNVPSLVAHKNRNTTTIVQITARSIFTINERSLNLESFEGVEDATVDLYSAVRNAYLQKRAKLINE